MTSEPQRLQYLEAMGLTVWVARYRLPNARPSEACEWVTQAPAAAVAPAERLHALLEEAEPPAAKQPASVTSPPPSLRAVQPGRARQMLGGGAGEAGSGPEAGIEAAGPPRETPLNQEPLRFSLQVACLDDRWLLLKPGDEPPTEVHLNLLGNLLHAVGISLSRSPRFQGLRWPPVEGLPAEAPLEEAREGVQAFIAGAGRHGWAPERVLLFGSDETLEQVLNLDGEHCELLDLPGWRVPDLEELANSAEAKRGLWPSLVAWREAWCSNSKGGAPSDTGDEAPGHD
ncbi:hypothetical protein [Halomonas chromatireducens]|uniref:Uncharacterized protein n=1 Tax=Halomonas chromatireducens TaxID=507626 RepID=A0A109UMU0_9GAMM|nr:hypothetical protein [Halomonas chromatireducens]AMD02067.1 hypothetical protein LOKO_03019 [Halomonas chromatireducens]